MLICVFQMTIENKTTDTMNYFPPSGIVPCKFNIISMKHWALTFWRLAKTAYTRFSHAITVLFAWTKRFSIQFQLSNWISWIFQQNNKNLREIFAVHIGRNIAKNRQHMKKSGEIWGLFTSWLNKRNSWLSE